MVYLSKLSYVEQGRRLQWTKEGQGREHPEQSMAWEALVLKMSMYVLGVQTRLPKETGDNF